MTQLTTMSPPLETAWSMNLVVVWKYLDNGLQTIIVKTKQKYKLTIFFLAWTQLLTLRLQMCYLPWNICFWEVVNMEAMVLDVIGGVLLGVHHHVFSCSVQHMGHLVHNCIIGFVFWKTNCVIFEKTSWSPRCSSNRWYCRSSPLCRWWSRWRPGIIN